MVRKIFQTVGIFFITLLTLLMVGCGTEDIAHVPVTEAWRQPLQVPVLYVVQPGDKLYSIAWMYGLDYRQIAKDNHIKPPYHIRTGQKLWLKPQANNVAANPPAKTAVSTVATTQSYNTSSTTNSQNNKVATKNGVVTPVVNTTPAATPAAGTTNKVANIVWTWPAQGKIVAGYDPSSLNRGIDIAGKTGDPVIAAANGRVVYAGNGLRGYGQLIIIKHNDDYLSAYAHNQTLLVKEGQSVRLGQQIATVGASEAKNPGLHFEIRLNGKPVDPMKYLPNQ